MIDILKEAREYTREEFLNEAAKCGSLFLCPRYSGLNQKCLSIVYDEKKCKECWREAVKDITFKSEEFTAICINDKTTRDKKVKVLGITEGKEYQVKPSKYANYYELVNDLGNVETYFMDRFKIIEKPVMEVGGIKFYKNGDFDISISKEEYEKGVEGDKMEDKTIKVRCIDNRDSEVLTLGKQYNVNRQNEDYFEIYLEDNKMGYFPKRLFEKVEDVLMVECVNNKDKESGLTIGKKYKVELESTNEYWIINDNGEEWDYLKTRFKQAEPQKEEKKEYSVMEVLEMPKGTILKLFPYDESERKIIVAEGIANNKYLYYIDDEGCHEEAVMISSWIMEKPRFRVVEEPKPVTTTEAFKALDEGKIIESVISKDKYKKINGIIHIEKEDGDTGKLMCMYRNELEGQWIIIEGDK